MEMQGSQGLSLVGPTEKPEPIDCVGGCGKQIEWVPRKSFFVRGTNPCQHCASLERLVKRENVRAIALDRAKLPPKLRGWSLDRLMLQEADEHPGDFMKRCRHTGNRPFGVLRANANAISELKDWTGGGSAFLFGAVGCGKSTIAAAIAERLAVPADEGYRDRTDAELEAHFGDKWERIPKSRRRVRVLHQARDVLFIDEAELMARVRLSWSGDRDPLKKVSAVGVLFLDDLGTEIAGKSEKAREVTVKAIERLISYRYDNELPTFITSNLDWEYVTETERPYGRRVASRLSEMVGGNYWHLRGPDWRNPPKPEAKRRRPQQDRKARASGEPDLFGGA